MQIQHFPAADRGTKDSGWLRSNFFFSFSSYTHPLKSAFGTLMAFNDDYLQPGKGFGIHPHINMEIISVLLKGKMNHKDTMGYNNVIEEGGVQIMSAGSGLKHEEYNVGEEEVNFLQIWIYPKLQNIIPRYQFRSFPLEQRKNRLVTIVSGEEGLGHCWINQNAKLSIGHFQKGASLSYRYAPTNQCVFLFLIEGGIRVGGLTLAPRDGAGIWDTNSFEIQCDQESQFLIIETVINQK